MIYLRADTLDFVLEEIPAIPAPKQVLLTTPEYFDVQYVINPHMEGHVGSVDPKRATGQWERLKQAYARIGITPTDLAGAADLPDMVFCANQTLPYYNPYTERYGVVLSRMHAEERRAEVEHYEAFFRENGYEVVTLPAESELHFEGMGDAIWHPGRYLLWGGYGFRTGLQAYRYIADALNVRILALLLEDPDFYHLDTCFSVLDEECVLLFPGAFQPEGLALIERFFPTRIEADETEARELFACNAHCPDGRHVLIQEGCEATMKRLAEAGFEPIPLQTDEFLKSGGSVFCMKQMFW